METWWLKIDKIGVASIAQNLMDHGEIGIYIYVQKVMGMGDKTFFEGCLVWWCGLKRVVS